MPGSVDVECVLDCAHVSSFTMNIFFFEVVQH